MLEEFEHTDNVNETGIIQRLQKGDKNAFTVLYRKYNKLIYTIAYRYLKNNEMSEDIVQHTFLRLWETKSLLQENMSIRNYLYTLAKNQVLNEIRNHTTAIEKNYNLLQDKSEIEDSLSKHIEDKDLTWFKTEEGQKWLSARMDKEEQDIILGQEEELINQKIHSDRIYRHIMHKMHSIKIKRWGLRIATALIPFILMAAIYTQVGTKIDFFAQSEFDEVTVPSGEHLQLLFQDGSKVYLNSNSHIRYPKKFSFFERKVYLEGEAWFEVSKEDNCPFVVDLNCLKVKVLGTKFNKKLIPETKM